MGNTFSTNELKACISRDLGIDVAFPLFPAARDRGSTACCVVDADWLEKLTAPKNAGQVVMLKRPMRHLSMGNVAGSEGQQQQQQQPKQSPTTNIYVSMLSKDPEKQIHFDLYQHSRTMTTASIVTAEKAAAINTASHVDQPPVWGQDGFSAALCDSEGIGKTITALTDSFHEFESSLVNLDASERQQTFVKHVQQTLWPNSRKFRVLTNDDSAQLLLQEDILEPENSSSSRSADLANSNLPDVFAIIESRSAYYFLASYKGTTLQDLITYNPGVLSSNLKKSFIVYQLIRALASLHGRGMLHGSLNASSILVDENLWIQLAGLEFSAASAYNSIQQQEQQQQLERHETNWTAWQLERDGLILTKSVQEEPLVMKWVRGDISNFSYLMALNHFAGRREGDPNFHPILPWITDFSGSRIEDGWRDFTKTKFRMNKGDEQLDFTFDGPVPHHITDILSDITYYVYLARRTPIPVLCQFVRSKYEPNEYPSSMQRLYSWTPDECIPEFYTDPSIFKSIHPDMPDLQIPQWASSPEDFIAKHAAALESDYVSENLHHWIDLTFGNNLTGKGAVEAKNVALPLLAGQNSFMKHGIIQLFKDKHPQRGCNWNKSKRMTDASLARKNISYEQQMIMHDSVVLPDRRSSKSAASIPSQRSSKVPRQASTSSSHLILSESPTNSYHIKECASSIHSTTSSIETSTSMTSKSVSTTAAEQIVSTGASSPAAGLTSALRTDPIRLPQEIPDDYFIENLTHFEETMSFASKYKDMQFIENLPVNPVYANSNVRFDIAPCTKPQIPETEFSKGAAYDMYCAGQIIQSIFNAGDGKIMDLDCDSHRGSAGGYFEVGNGNVTYDVAPTGTISISQTVTDVLNALTASQWQERPSAKSILCASMPTVTIRDPKRSLPIPECIPEMYEYLASFHQAENSRRLYLADKWIDRMSELGDEAFLLVLPTFTQLFSQDATRVGSISLFPRLAQRLGAEKARKYLLKPIIFMFEALRPNIPRVLFSHRTIDEFVRRLGTATFLQQVLPCYLEAVAITVGESKPTTDEAVPADSSNLSVPELAGDAVLHVCVVLGPILTSKHIIRQLTKIVLRENASRQILLQTFGEICQIFGETFASIQFSYLLGLIDQYNKQAVTEKNVLTLMNIMKLLEAIAPAMSSASLATELKSGFITVFYKLLEPLTPPENQKSVSEKAARMRLALSLHTIEHLVSISRHLVSKDWETTMTTMLQKYFSGFTTNITSDQSPQPGLFPEPMVAQKNYQMMYAYFRFAELVGGETMHRIIPTSNSIDKLLCDQFGLEPRSSDQDPNKTYASVNAEELRRRAADSLPLVSNAAPAKCNGLKKEVPPVKDNQNGKEVKEKESKPKAPISVLPWKTKWKPSPEDRKNWNRFLSTNSEEMSKSMQFSFNDLKLRGYAGHTAAIRTITVNEPRKLFASGARDRTVKIWSLNVHDGIENWESNPYSECLVTYNGHRRGAVTDVHFLVGIGRGLTDIMASCDGVVHLWDPETGKGIHQFASGRPSVVTTKPIYHSRNLVGGTTEGNLLFFDVHNYQLLHTWKSNANMTGTIRVIATNQSDTLIAIGFSTGAISLLDSRTGTLVASWKGGDTEITMLKFYTDELLVSCAPGDHQICCWNVCRLALLKTMSAPQDIISLDIFKDEILTINNNNSISFTPINDELQSYSSKFKPSIIKSQVSAFAIVPTDPSLLFGCTEGEIFLYA